MAEAPVLPYRKVNCETFVLPDHREEGPLDSMAGMSGNVSDAQILDFVREFLAERATDRGQRKLVIQFSADSAH